MVEKEALTKVLDIFQACPVPCQSCPLERDILLRYLTDDGWTEYTACDLLGLIAEAKIVLSKGGE